jgi:hypothetical protein
MELGWAVAMVAHSALPMVDYSVAMKAVKRVVP